jgi:hypothetical protein
MGAQNSLLNAILTDLMPITKRNTGFRLFYNCYGVAWFLGLKILVFTTCDTQPLPGSGMQDSIRERLWRYWAIDVCKHRRATRTRRMMDYVEQLKPLRSDKRRPTQKSPK